MHLDASPTRVTARAALKLTLALTVSACLDGPAPTEAPLRSEPGLIVAPLGEPGTPYTLTAPQTTSFASAEDEVDFVRLTVLPNHQGLRIAVRADVDVDVAVRRTTHDGAIVGGAQGYDAPLHTFFFTPEDTVGDDQWWIEIHSDLAAHIDVQAEPVYARPLPWDGGATLAGTTFATRPSGGFGDHLYRISAQPALYGAWRNVLKVTAGEADLSMAQGSFPNDFAYHGSAVDGSDAVVLAQPEFQENQTWYLRVRARSGDADWSLLSGDIHVVDFGPLGDAPNVRALTLDVGGVGYFRTEATAQTLAWRLSTPGARFYVNDTAMPVVRYGSSTWDIQYEGEGLIVPDYLKAQGYLVAVTADAPTVQVDSRNHLVIDPLDVGASDPFTFAIDGDDDGFSYVTYEVAVPFSDIAWQVALTPTSGDVDLYIGKSRVPSELDNDAMSEALATTDTVTMVPQTLTDGTFYVTVRGQAPFAFTLTSGAPEITPIAFTSTDAPNGAAHEDRVGWRYFSVPKDGSALGTLGWIVELADHVPGTLIALRENFVPGRWSYRDFNGYGGTVSHVDLESDLGFLEHPNHPDEFWYVGIYNPDTPLGPFLLDTRAIEATDLDFDGGVVEVTNQGSGRWRYFRVVVPPDMLGWDLRLDGVTSGRPRAVVRAELVPGDHLTSPPYYTTPFWAYDEWDSGDQWALGADLTRRPYRWIDEPNQIYLDETGRFFLSGHGNPLRQGTFYIGVSDTWTTLDGAPMSYTLRSRGIGDGEDWSIPVQDLAFAGGTRTATGLGPREIRVYRVDVPPGSESWYLELTPQGGDAMMAVRKDMVPSVEAGWWAVTSDSPTTRLGARRQKNGVELFYRYPDQDKTTLEPGTYYVVVAVEGVVTAQDGYIGGGTTGFLLESHGVAPVTPGTLTTEAPLAYADQHLRYGEQRAYRVSVPAGLSSLEIRLVAHAGNPWMNVSDAAAQPSPNQSYPAAEGGRYTPHSASDVITIQGPTSDTYTVLVTARADDYGTPLEADFDLVIEARGETVLPFNDGSIAVSDQATQTWRYFRVDVPAHALGWDLRLANVAGRPKMVIRRGALPTDFYEQPQYPTIPYREAWDEGGTWAPTGELTQRNNAHYYTDGQQWYGGEDESGRAVVMGLGSPLEAGTYYVGVSDTWSYESGPAMQYEIVSRGIGKGEFAPGETFTIPVTDLDFEGGTATVTHDDPRDDAWYRVLVPESAPSWEVSLVPTTGDAMMAVRHGALPNSSANVGYYEETAGSRRQKDGREHYYRYPAYASGTSIPGGYHYIGVGAEGQDAYSSSYIGHGSTTYTLTSHGAVDVQSAPEPLGVTPIRFDDQALLYGEQRVYRVEVPAGVESMEIRFEGKSGHPDMTVQRDAIPTPTQSYVAAYGGDSYIAYGDNVVSLAEPLGVYYIVVAANYGPQAEPSAASYDLVIEAIGEAPLAFNGGEATVTNQASQTFRYFRVEVPAGALGWDLRLHDVTGRPRMVIRRDERPVSLDSDPAYYPPIAGRGEWQPGWRWAPTGELTQRNASRYYFDGEQWVGGDDETGRRVSMGMGTPLEPGTYLVGVSDAYPHDGGPMSYRIVSRGIGVGLDDQEPAQPWAIQVRDLVFGVEDSVADLDPREHAYYRLQIPEGLESWSVELEPTQGEVMMALREGGLPNADASLGYSSSSDDGYQKWGTRRQKNGRDWFYKLPWNEARTVAGGTWYIGVGAEGQDPYGASYIGTGKSGFEIRANGPVPIAGGPDQVVASSPLVFAGERLAWGQQKYYRFRVPPTVAAFEVRLANRLGDPAFEASVEPYFEPRMPATYGSYYYASEGGSAAEGGGDVADQIVDRTGDVTVVVHANGSEQVENGYDLVITPLETRPLAWDGGDETVTLKDQEAVYFKVEVPQDCDGVAQAGWIVSQEVSSGQVTVDVRKDYLPDSPYTPDTLVTTARQTIIAPPYLSPGTWYVAVRATGNAQVRIRTSEVKERRHWVMPERGQTGAPPGLSHPFFGDTAVLDDGSAGPNGIDLGEGQYHFYRFTVPADNRGVFRTRLDAISGDPELYIRRGAAATLNQMPAPWNNYDYVDYRDTEDGSTYGHWVVPDTRYGEALAPGEYWIAVYAQGSQVRYRLTLDVGQATALPLNSAPLQGALAAGDMRYYQVSMPQTTTTPGAGMPQSWTLSLNQRSGDALVLIREAVPPGLYDQVVDPGSIAGYQLTDWNDDRSAYGYGYPTLPELDDTGTLTLSMPLLRPNTTYWVGVYARTDTTFDIGSSISASTFSVEASYPYRDATLSATVPANQLRLYRIDVPSDAGRYWHRATVPPGIHLYLSVGYVPPLDASYANWSNYGYTDPAYNELDRGLESPGGYVGNHPWVAGASYYLVAENTTGEDLAIEVELDGRDRLDDSDGDTLADAWEYKYFGSLYSNAEGDADGDTLSNGFEEGVGTDPTDIDSDDDALADGLELVAGGNPLLQDTDLDQVCDGSDSAPDDPEQAGKVIRLYMHRYDDGSYGHGHGTNEHLTRLVAVFERFPEEGHWLHVRGWDIEQPDEVEVLLNGEHLGYLPVGGDGQYSIPVMYFIPSFQLFQSGDNRLELRQKVKGEAWGAIDLGVFSDGDTFGYDSGQAYDQRHPLGFDVHVAQMPDSLIELTAFDLEAADEVSVTVNGQPWLDRIAPTPNDKWTPFYQVPFVPADQGPGPYHLQVRRKGASDGDWQLRLMARRDLTTTFGNDGAAGEGGAHTQAFHFLYPNKPGQRELVLRYKATPNDLVEVEDTDGTLSIWTPTESWLWSPNQAFFSEGAAHDTVTVKRNPAEPPLESPSFSVEVVYYGPCADVDGSGVLDCEEVCEDLDNDLAFAISPLCGVGNDCDDNNPSVGPNTDDADCDGVPTANDCDDADPQVTATNTGDADCDGVPTATDCDDADPQVTATNIGDADCDGVPTATDCDDADPQVTASNIGDADCDGSPTGTDCDDDDPQVQTCDTCVDADGDTHDAEAIDCPGGDDCDDGDAQSTWRAIDADCDGVPTTTDCNDANASDTRTKTGDADCDGVPTASDCNDNNASDTRTRTGDADCDGVPTASDCNDNNASDTRTRTGDADCDGVPTASDCNDNDPGNTRTNAGDADCDGVASGSDCNDNDASNTRSKVGDADCDGVATADDCNDADASNTTARSNDADCDGVATSDDCNDADPAVVATRAGDLDCDGVASTVDCNDADPTVVATKVGDLDCDRVPSAVDCNDNNPAITASKVGDADCDGVPTAIDCNDNSAANKNTNVGDADCDGVATTVDCNDGNPAVRNTNVNDVDCDRVSTSLDCNDRDAADTRTRTGDFDCDMVATSVDCDDTDPRVTATRVGDADCDKVATSVDCDDTDPAITTTRVGDADCDGIASAIDCDDDDPAIRATTVGDADCDGIATVADCDDADAGVTVTRTDDADCDGVASDLDCDDADAADTRRNLGDRDCDGVASDIDCDDGDATRKATRLNDADCDGVSTPIDCDDGDDRETRTQLDDADCDDVRSALDCDDHDPSVTATRTGDEDCDGVASALDCDDANAAIATTRAEDGDCDGVLDGEDCAPADASIATSTASDGDCDGVERGVDCDDDDGDVKHSRLGDGDCDGVPTALDCDDADARETVTTTQDGDCDGVAAALDCDDADPSERGSCGACVDGDADGFFGAGPGCARGDDCDDDDAASTHRGVDADCDGVVTREDCDDEEATLGAAVDDHDCDGVPAGVDCDDLDASEVDACEERCEDRDGDGHDGRGPYCAAGTDCDDGDASSTTRDADGDCDGVIAADDCDDDDPTSGTRVADADCDGSADDDDVCPDEPDPAQRDDDDDGVGDACDVCPAIADDQSDDDGDGTGDACEDADGDGVVDADDNCPAAANANQRDLDHDGLGDACDEPVKVAEDGGCGAGGLPAVAALVLWGLWAGRRRVGRVAALIAGLFAASGCGDGADRRPIGANCEDAAECVLGLCSGGFCLDPDADDDYDGLVNGLEVEVLGTDPLLADTDGDGLPDGEELVALDNADGDGDGRPDALESASEDRDADCIPDQYDAEDGVNNSDLTPLFEVLCASEGVCGVDRSALSVRCAEGDKPYCDYSEVIGFEDDEVSCDGLDNDCDGATDENLPEGACPREVVAISIEPGALTLWKTTAARLTVIGRYDDGGAEEIAGAEVVWESEDEAVVSVADGIATAVAEGGAAVKARVAGLEARVAVTVVGACAPGEEVIGEVCEGVGGDLVGHYRLDGDGRDASGYFAHGNVYGAEATSDRFGAADRAMAFCEAGDRVEVPGSRHPLGDVTVSYAFWVKPAGERADEAIVSAGRRAPGRRSAVVLRGSDDCVAYVGAGDDAVSEGMCVPPDRWTFVVVVKDAGAARFYVNGALVDTRPAEGGQDVRSATLQLGVGAVEGDGAVHEQLCGALDDVRVYARALADEEIDRLYRLGGWQDVGTRANPARDCDHVLGSRASHGDDVYWLDPDGDGAGEAFEARCDMTRDGGGWTLAWVYGFTDYAAFASVGNAVSPRPTWPAPGADVAMSDEAPADETTPGAIAWELWRHLGETMRVTSNVNDHVVCRPLAGTTGGTEVAGGSLAAGTSGPVSCEVVAEVAPACDGVVPVGLGWGPYGPSLAAEELYYYWDGSTQANWPTHDPCGRDRENQVPSVLAPHGAVWLRHRP